MATEPDDAGSLRATPSSPKELCNALYASCASQPPDKIFNQQDLLSLKIIPGDKVADQIGELVTCLNRLTSDGLFKMYTKDGKPCWKVIKKEDAKK